MLSFREELHKIWDQYAEKVLIEDDVVRWTGAQLAEKTAQISKLIIQSAPVNSRVGLCFPNWASLGLAFLACIEAGRVPVLIDYLDVDENDSEWLQKKQLSCIILDDSLKINFSVNPTKSQRYFSHPMTSSNTSATLNVQHQINEICPIFYLSRTGDLKASPENVSGPIDIAFKIQPEGTFSILYTSGSTGQSKGIFIPELGVLKTVEFLKSQFKMDSNIVAPIVLPICYSMALNTQFLPTLLSGGKSVFINSRLNYNKLYLSILNSKGTFLALIGDILHTCWEEKNKRKLPPSNHVQHIQLAGGTILPEHLKMARELFPNAVVHKGYGLTEAIRVSMIQSDDPDFFTESVGKPLPFVDIEIRNEDNQAVGPQQVGEIFVKGPNVMLGICSRFAKITDSNGYLACGDLGYINDKGHLVILGRKDGVFKIHGRKVSGFVYEREALLTSPMVKAAKCVSADDEKRLSQKIILFLEIHKNLGTAERFSKDLVSFITDFESRLKRHSFYPKDIVIVSKVPRTHNGKIQLSCLKSIWTQKEYLDRVVNLNSTLKVHFYQKTDSVNYLNEINISASASLSKRDRTNRDHYVAAKYETTEQNL